MIRGFFSFKREDLFRKWDKVGKQNRPDDQKFTSSDIMAMIIAVISIVLPWLLAIAGGLALVLFLVWKFYLKG
jgi:hypothetical protein